MVIVANPKADRRLLMSAILRELISFALVAAACLVTGCQLGTNPPQTAPLQAEERKDDTILQLARCETGGVGPSEQPIYGGKGAYIGRMQFSVQTVISYQKRKDGKRLSPQEATKLAHDYDRAAELAKYMIFDLEEPWHWPHCAKRILLRSAIAAVKDLSSQALQATRSADLTVPNPSSLLEFCEP
jgi:hypothetical protein